MMGDSTPPAGGVIGTKLEPYEVAALRVRPTRVTLGPGPDPAELLRGLAQPAGADSLACVWGEWTGGVAIFRRPISIGRRVGVLDQQPTIISGHNPSPAQVAGGWVGLISYDGRAHFAFYDHVLLWCDGRWYFEALRSRDRAGALAAELAQARSLIAATGVVNAAGGVGYRVGGFRETLRDAHLAAVDRAITLIRAGEMYQANICARLGAPFEGSAAALFADAATRLRPRWGAFVEQGERAVASLSPELFLQVDGRRVSTSPIKGTRPRRDNDLDTKASTAKELSTSAKEVAENIMIVDLLRNDLGRVCEPGSVRPTALLDVQAHPGVWHLVSSVAGTLRADVGTADLLDATFPPGSVTGAPKRRARQAIAELESRPRGVYTGAIGIAGPLCGLRLNVAIRTFEVADGRIELGVGGGITAGSVPMREWRECLDKAEPLVAAIGGKLYVDDPAEGPAPLESVARTSAVFGLAAGDAAGFGSAASELVGGGLLETILAVDGVPLRLADHLARLGDSAHELYGGELPADIDQLVSRHAGSGRAAIRIELRPDQPIAVSAGPAPQPPASSQLRVAVRPAGLWRHKWADRRWIIRPDSLLADERGQVLETERGNVFILADETTLVTAPLDDRILPGVTRRALLDLAFDLGLEVQLRPFTLAELFGSAAAFWTSSLSGVVPITTVDGRAVAQHPRVADLRAALAGFAG